MLCVGDVDYMQVIETEVPGIAENTALYQYVI